MWRFWCGLFLSILCVSVSQATIGYGSITKDGNNDYWVLGYAGGQDADGATLIWVLSRWNGSAWAPVNGNWVTANGMVWSVFMGCLEAGQYKFEIEGPTESYYNRTFSVN